MTAAPAPAPPTDEDRINSLLSSSPDYSDERDDPREAAAEIAKPLSPAALEYAQWAREPNGVFRPTCSTTHSMPPGCYCATQDERGLSFQRMDVFTDSLIILDDTASERVVRGIRQFWQSRARYDLYHVIYKRGILLWGPAGSGKTGTVMLLAQELIALGGLVILVFNAGVTGQALKLLRRVEPSRPVILIFEDIDELIKNSNEHVVLALLDGEFQIPNCVCIATTNYPERLGPRIINRPSRFDERIFIDTPNPLARERYLRHITKHEAKKISAAEIARWVQDSAGFSIAHLRELVIAVRCLGHEYSDVITRLKSMQKAIRPLEDYPGQRGGFQSSAIGGLAQTQGNPTQVR